MSPESPTPAIRLKRELFLEALEKRDPKARADFLDVACGKDAQLRQRVEELLREQLSVEGFLEQPVWSVAASPKPGHSDGSKAPRVEQPGDYIGPYRLVQKLGEGGCGVVYLARQEQPLRREVALKVIKLGMDTLQVIARFEAERQTLALMDHPHIARVLDAGATETGRPFFVMELVRGIKITDFCDQNRLTTKERLRLFVRVCQGLEHAHQKGVIHRDIKPSNVLVTSSDHQALPKIIDFGIARAIHRTIQEGQTLVTGLGQLIGTPAYMSPEQAAMGGLDIDTRSDIYSLGVLLYELLTGRTPFDGEFLLEQELDECRRIIRQDEPLRPSTHLSTLAGPEFSRVAHNRNSEPSKLVEVLRGDLDWVVMKALEKDRTRRYANASSLAQDVENYLADEPVLARPPTNFYRLQKLVHRHRTVFSAVTLLAVILVLGTAISTWLAIRAKQAETQARLSEKMETQLRREAERERRRATAQAELAGRNEYVADINLAQQSLSSGNYGRAIQSLKKHLPQPGKADLRGFEWRYLWNISRGDKHRSLSSHGGSVRTLAISPDGRWLASGTDSNLNLWDLATASLSHTFLIHQISAVFSPNHPELIVSTPSEVRRIDLTTGAETELPDQEGGVLALDKSAARLAIAGRDGVRIWDTKTWIVQTNLPGATGPIVFSPDGKYLAANTRIGVALWELTTFTEQKVLRNSQRLFWSRFSDQLGQIMAFTPDGQYLAAPQNTPTDGGVFFIRLWKVETGEEVGTLPNDPESIGHTGAIAWMAVSPDGSLLASASMDHSIRLWDLASKRPLLTLHGHLSEVWTLAFSPDGKTLISGAKDGSVNLWSIPPDSTHDLIEGPYIPVTFSRDGNQLAVLDQQRNCVLLLDLATRKTMAEFPLQASRGPSPFALSADLQVLAEGLANGTTRVHNLPSHETVELETGEGPVVELALSPDARQLVTGGFRQPLRWWQIASRTNTVLGMERRTGMFSPDGSTLLVIAGADRAELWDTATHSVRTILHTESALGGAAAFSPDGHVLALASHPLNSEQTISLWETDSGRSLGVCLGHKQGIHFVAFTPDSRTLASTSDDGTLKLWSISTQQELLSLPMHGGARKPLFTPDGSILALGEGRQQRGIRFYSAPQPQDSAELNRAMPIP